MNYIQRYLTKKECEDHYKDLIALHFRQASVIDKANRLRTRFDIILKAICQSKNGGSIPREITEQNAFKNMVNDIFKDVDLQGKILKNDLHKIRLLFNNKVQHLENKGFKGGPEKIETISEKEYKFCLKTVAEFVAFFGGVPIPPTILDACLELEDKNMIKYLDVVIVLQLFDSIDRIDKGILVYNSLHKMITEHKDRFDKLNVQIVLYNPSIITLTPLEQTTQSPVNDALERGLEFLDKAINRWTKDRTNNIEKPWFIWLCYNLESLDAKLVNRLTQITDANLVGFYPIDMGDNNLSNSFLGYWPNCRPIPLKPELAQNFFKSVLLTIQRMQNK